MNSVLKDHAPWPGAVGVSGGSDSTALSVLLAEWAGFSGHERPVVLTVDHGLVRNSARIAEEVVTRARTLGLEAHILAWSGRKPNADIENAARRARYRLMGEWCETRGIRGLYVAHTRDDQAETFLLRLARGSGVDGLAAMAQISNYPLGGFDNVRVVRPLLSVPRARLRPLLTARSLDWHEDEMNSDPRFARSRLRAAWPSLEEAGLSKERIAAAASHLARARVALDHDVVELLAKASRSAGKDVLLDSGLLATAPREIGLRALARVLMQVSARDYRPRFERLETLFDAICAGKIGTGRTLHGCTVRPASRCLAFFGPGTLAIGQELRLAGGC